RPLLALRSPARRPGGRLEAHRPRRRRWPAAVQPGGGPRRTTRPGGDVAREAEGAGGRLREVGRRQRGAQVGCPRTPGRPRPGQGPEESPAQEEVRRTLRGRSNRSGQPVYGAPSAVGKGGRIRLPPEFTPVPTEERRNPLSDRAILPGPRRIPPGTSVRRGAGHTPHRGRWRNS